MSKLKRPRVFADDVFVGGGEGFCSSPDCFAESYGVEPDACNYTCEACHRESVFGIEEAVSMGIVDIIGEDDQDNSMEAIIDRSLEAYETAYGILHGRVKAKRDGII
jgi:hypothetical protein